VTADNRHKIVYWATVLVITISFAGSYSSGVAWIAEHLSADHFARDEWCAFLAAVPELAFLMAALRLKDDVHNYRLWIVGAGAFAWNLWTNGAQAAPGPSGMFVALLPALGMAAMLWINGHTPKVSAPVKKRSATRVREGSTVPNAVAWARTQPNTVFGLPSRKDFVAAGFSDTVGKRARAILLRELEIQEAQA
jgi:hypothetical protein